MNSPLISIIVPVYNTEKYLDQCIQSVLAQTYTNWELLLIDDGTTDSSGAICDKYAAEDNRIQVVHKQNTGVSDSKNIALDMARGEYIMFLDSDDYWCINDCLAQLYTKSQELGVDIVRGEYNAVDEAGNLLFERALNTSKQQAINKILTPYQFLTEVIQGEFFLWLALFKKSAIGDVRFNMGKCFLEDLELYAHIFSQSPPLCAYFPLRFYAYRKHEQAISAISTHNKLQDSFAMCDIFASLATKCSHDVLLQQYYQYNAIMMYYWTLETLSQNPYYHTRAAIIENLGIKELQKRTSERVHQFKIFNKYYLFFVCPPAIGLHLCRWKTKVSTLLHHQKSHI